MPDQIRPASTVNGPLASPAFLGGLADLQDGPLSVEGLSVG
jgi:hypothetical protein